MHCRSVPVISACTLHCAFWHVRSEVKSKASDLSCRLTAVLPSERQGDPTLALPYVTMNLAIHITFDASIEYYTHVTYAYSEPQHVG